MVKRNRYAAAGHSMMDGNIVRERRRGYFRGKYNREVFTTLLLIAFVAMCAYRLGS